MSEISGEHIREFQGKLLSWYSINGRVFPWRKKKINRYQVVISEVLLQRTKAENVNKVYKKFIERFPNWEALAATNLIDLQRVLQPLGLQIQRAKRLKALSSVMVKLKGKFPENRVELDKIPFVGQYIGNAIELIIHKRNRPLLDVNMSRLLERYFGERKLSDIRYDPYLQKLSHKVVQHRASKELNWSILDFAALHCKAQNPNCKTCIFRLKCAFFKKTQI
jgi:A/G-specific adenine glycosylase